VIPIIQFDADVENDTIEIPKKFRVTVPKGKVHVMLVTSHIVDQVDKTKAGILSLDGFTELKLPTNGYKFNREETNVRR
jgi:hypothetical protein